MADEEDLKLLTSGERDLSSCDFRGANLAGADLGERILSKSHFEGANLEGAILRGASLEGVHLAQANLSKADLRNAKLGRVFVSVNFTGADARGAKFSGILQGACFDGADLRGTDFTGCTINEGCTFVDAKYDETTKFDGVKTLRSIARQPLFSRYRFEKGQLVLGTLPSSVSDFEANPLHDVPQPRLEDVGEIEPIGREFYTSNTATVISRKPREISALANGLIDRISEEIAELSLHLPNDPEAVNAHTTYLDFLNHILEQLKEITSLLEEAVSGPQSSSATKIEAAALRLDGIGNAIADWTKDSGKVTVKYGINVGLLGLGSLFLSACGVESAAQFPVLAFLLCGKEIGAVIGKPKD